MNSTNTQELVKCSNCKVSRTPENFIGKTGKTVKTCLKCREKDDRQKKRPDVIEKRNARGREKQYYKAYREKKREENEEEYLKHNAEIAKNWRNANKEHVAAWSTNNFNRRLRAIKQQSQKKGIFWDPELTDEICREMMMNPCFYCDYISEKTLNGIDRMDNQDGYTVKNAVSCCKNCNFIKATLDPVTFIQRCQHIAKRFGKPGNFNPDAWPDTGSTYYEAYLIRAIRKNLEFSLTQEQFENFKKTQCYYCNKKTSTTHSSGIDRKNNEIGYNDYNCVSCCSECNYMKGVLNEEEFVEVCSRVSSHTTINNLDIPDIKKCMISVMRRKKNDVSQEKFTISNKNP